MLNTIVYFERRRVSFFVVILILCSLPSTMCACEKSRLLWSNAFVMPAASLSSQRLLRRACSFSSRFIATTATLLFTAVSPMPHTAANEQGFPSSSAASQESDFHRLRCRPKVFFILGGPGAGKGTQCERMVERYGFCHLSAGDLLRKERQSGSKDGQLIDEYIREGKIVPVEISLGLLKKAMQTTPEKRFLIDGFPRNWDNVQGWDKLMKNDADVEAVVFFDCPEQVMEERLLIRGQTSGRTDDNIESARKRFRTFLDSTMPVVTHYEKQGLVSKIPGHIGSPEDVFEITKSVVDLVLQKELLALSHELLDAITNQDYEKYKDLCAESLTAFEPEAQGARVEGMEFHKFYFERISPERRRVKSTISSPHVRVMGKSAVVSYHRVIQAEDLETGILSSTSFAETRVWERIHGTWKHVHFHRSHGNK